MKLELSADEVLTTTRSVRKRLDFDKPVGRDVILECLAIALQAPTGSNSQGWHWMFVEDQAKKDAIAAMYKRNFDEYAKTSRQYPEGDLRAEQITAVRSSAQYLADNFQRVPVLMIPLIEGRLDNASVVQGASAWGSLLPAVWSFMLALRERGLGSAWTTLHLPNERETADLLGIPFDRYTQGGLFPIAYTIGTEFKPAKRLDLTPLVHFDTF
ncbi:MAG: nitroreductase family protein [Acidimicrobiia bacterium]